MESITLGILYNTLKFWGFKVTKSKFILYGENETKASIPLSMCNFDYSQFPKNETCFCTKEIN